MKTVLPGRMLATNFGAVAIAHSTGLAIAGVTALEHSTSTSGIVAGHLELRALHLHWHLWGVKRIG
jgi:hypothetical protein